MHLYFYVTFKKMSYYLRNFTQKNLEISRENTKAWKRKFCSRNDFVPLCTYLFFWLPICDQHLNQSTFLLILFCSIILHAWKIWKYINTSITIIQQRKNLFSSSRNLAGPCFFTLRKLQCGYFPQIIHWFEYLFKLDFRLACRNQVFRLRDFRSLDFWSLGNMKHFSFRGKHCRT